MKKRRKSWKILVCMILGIAGLFMVSNREICASNVQNPYKKQEIGTLLDQELLKVSDSDKIVCTKDEKAGGVFISGEVSNLKQEVFSIDGKFNFDENILGFVSVDGLSARGENVSLEFYLDDETTPFATVKLSTQKRKDKWNYVNTQMADVSSKKILGSHKISWKILCEGNKKCTFLLRSIEFMQNSIPVVSFDIDESQGIVEAMNGDPDHDTECYGTMTIKIPENYKSEYTSEVLKTKTYELDYIRGRGNSTWMQDKKPYKIKLNKKADLLGMGSNKHWVLLANRLDNSFLRNKGTYWLGTQLGMPFTPKSEFVDVILNGTYYGSYCLSEQIRVGKNRVDIADLEENEETKAATDETTISGGYLLSMEPYGDEEELSFETTRNNNFLIESPSFEGYKNDAQYQYIKNYVQKTEDAIYGKNFKDKEGNSFADYMDIKSTIDYYWVQEISQNGDAFATTSTYLYKDRGGKLCWGPLWDFDYVAWGSYDYSPDVDCSGWTQKDNTWFERLFRDKSFAKKVVERWPEVRAKLLELSKDGGQLDQYKEKVSTSQQYDFEKWGFYNFDEEFNQCSTYQEEVDRFKNWIRKRVQWIDENVNSLIPAEYKVTFKNDGKKYGEQTVLSNDGLTEFPKEPKKKGYVFAGWYDGDGERYEVGSEIDQNIVLYARWVKENQIVPVKQIYFLSSMMYVDFYEDGYYLGHTVMPENATLKNLVWSSSNTSIATVDQDGYVSFKKTGDVVITAKASNGKSAKCQLHIVDFEEGDIDIADDFSLDKKSVAMKVNEYQKVTPILSPKNSMMPEILWRSSNESVASVSETGVITGNKAGSATIVAISPSLDKVLFCKVTVTGSSNTIKKGSKVVNNHLIYKVVSNTKKTKTVACIGMKKQKTGVTIPASIKIKGKKYKVVSIGKQAFKTKSKLKKIVVGVNVTKIGEKAFYKCKNLKNITIKTKKLKSVGKNACYGISSKAVIRVPKKKLKTYQRILKNKGKKKLKIRAY